jgi:hypothetical protein
MQSTHPARNAEREFLDSLRGPAAAPSPIARARATQRAIDDSRPLRIPCADAIEVPFTDLTQRERDSFFAAFDDTQPAGWA